MRLKNIYTKILLLFLMLFCGNTAKAQLILQLQGTISAQEGAVQNAHVENIYTGEQTVTDSNGFFLMQAQAGDVLLISHIAYNEARIIVSETNIERAMLAIALAPKTNELKEVSLSVNTSITPESVGIVSETKRIPTRNERRLHTAGDFKAIHLLGLLGGSLAIDPILNAINGRTARLKKYIATDKKIAINEALTESFKSYLQETLTLSNDEAIQYFDYLTDDENIEGLLQNATDAQLEIYLVDNYKKFQEILAKEQRLVKN